MSNFKIQGGPRPLPSPLPTPMGPEVKVDERFFAKTIAATVPSIPCILLWSPQCFWIRPMLKIQTISF